MSDFNIHEFRQRKKRERLALEASYKKGARDAAAKFGAEAMPSPAHGVEKAVYPAVDRPQQDPNMPDWLFDIFADGKEAPDNVSGYGTETIG